jgi:hypothetical protein
LILLRFKFKVKVCLASDWDKYNLGYNASDAIDVVGDWPISISIESF